MTDKPTLVLVPGAWHNIETWDRVSALLGAQYCKCVPVGLPTTAGNVSVTFGDEAEAVRASIIAETTQGRDVVVVVHSYSSAISQSAIKGLTHPHQDLPLSTNTQPEWCFLDGFGGKPPPSWKLDPSGLAIITGPPRKLFYHDLPEEEGDYWVSKLRKQSLKAMTEGREHSCAGWMDVTVWILVTTENKALPIQAQKMFMQIAKDGGANITVREVASSLSPILSRPKETANFIAEAVTSFRR